MAPSLDIGVLGPLHAVVDGEQVALGPPQQRLVLTALLVADGPLGVERLIDLVWPTAPPARARHTVQQYVSRLRRLLPADVLITVAGGYHLDLPADAVDARRFCDLADRADAAAASGAIDEAVATWQRAESLWRGEPFVDVPGRPFVESERRRLTERRLAVVESRLASVVDAGDDDGAIAELRGLVDRHPHRERLWTSLMRGLAAAGRRVEALEAYRDLHARLAAEQGVEPGTAVQALHRRLLADPSPGSDGGSRSLDAAALPASRSTPFGRDDEAAAIREGLATARLVTITGPGGMGKTHLALRVLRRLQRGGASVTWVELEELSDPGDVLPAVGRAVGVRSPGDRDDVRALVHHLRNGEQVLALDSCEHVLAGVTPLVDHVLRACPGLRVLATSREALGSDGEHRHHLTGLTPRDAVALFRHRAAAVADAARLPVADDDIAAICETLDRMPLAIELAAARAAHLSVAEIAGFLDQRLWLLTGQRRRVARHRTLRATLDWSHDLLDEEERAVLRAVAVFRGSATATAVAATSGLHDREAVDLLASLASKSLVVVEPDGGDGTRYRLLESIRWYARRRLEQSGEEHEVRRRHAEHVLSTVADPSVVPTDMPEWGIAIRELADRRDVIGALHWLESVGRRQDVGRLASRLVAVAGQSGFVDPHRRYLGRDEVDEAMAGADDRPLYRLASAQRANVLGRHEESTRWVELVTDSTEDRLLRSWADAIRMNNLMYTDPAAVLDGVEEVLDRAPETATRLRRFLSTQRSNALTALGHLDEAAADLRRQDSRLAFTVGQLTIVLALLDRHDEPTSIHPDDPADLPVWRYLQTLGLAVAAARSGDLARSWVLLERTAEHAASSPFGFHEAVWGDVLVGVAVNDLHADRVEAAITTLAAAGGHIRTPAAYAARSIYTGLARGAVPRARRQRLIEEGRRRLPSEEARRRLGRRSSPA